MSLRNALENWVGVAHLNRQRCQHHVRGAAAVSEFASELRISMQQKTHRTTESRSHTREQSSTLNGQRTCATIRQRIDSVVEDRV